MANTTTGIEKEKEKGQKDKIGTDDIGIFEFIFKGLPEPPELEGVDEDRLRDLQSAVQEQLHKRERNIIKRVQEFKKTFDFVNSPPKRSVRHNLAVDRSVTPFIIQQPIRRPHLLERVYKPMHTPH